jgi:hypothetical protein
LQTEVYELVFITETWLNDAFPDALLCNECNYQMLRCDRKPGERGGGVACFVKNDISVSVIENKEFENLEAISFNIKFSTENYRFCCVYSPPSYSESNKKHLYQLIDSVCSSNYPSFILGDFNEPNINWQSPDPSQNNLVETVFRNGLEQIVNAPTRAQNILDLIFTNDINTIEECFVGVPFSSSDHNSIVFSLHDGKCEESLILRKNFHSANYEYILQTLEYADWPTLFSHCINVEDFWTTFSDVLNKLINDFVPCVSNRRNRKPIHHHLKKLLNKKQKLWKQLKLSNDVEMRQNYNKCLREIKKFTLNQRVETEKNILNNGSSNFFKFVNSNMKMKNRIPDLVSDNIYITDVKEKVEQFNKYFASVFTHDNGITPSLSNISINQIKNCSFTIEKIRLELKSLKSNLSSGPDGFPPIFLKKLADGIAIPLSTIFEISFRTHKLPKNWLESKVIVLHKKGPKNRVENYRPISLTSVCCKVMESIIKKHIVSFLDTNNILSPLQYGFRSGQSTSSQLLHCTNHWTKSIDRKIPVDVIYLDFAKAFDTVSHTKLFQKLQNTGIKGDLLAWIIAFLSNRTQQVNIESTSSNRAQVISGVPQGSVLGPILFLIYINDLPAEIITNTHCVMFADDVKIYQEINSSSDSEALQASLEKIISWANKWQINLSASKCNVLHLGKTNNFYEYFIDNKLLESNESCRDLGILMTPDGKYSKHIKNIVKTAYFKISSLFKIFESRNVELLKKAYICYVRPSLEYCSVIWSPHYIQDISLIERVQKYFTRKLLSNRKKASYSERLAYLQLESLEERRIKIDLIETFKFFTTYQHRSFNSYFSLNPNPHKNSNDLFISYYRTDTRKFWFANRVCPWWNSLPNNVKTAQNINQFKNLINRIDFKHFCQGPITLA